jgi:hypothetical protein
MGPPGAMDSLQPTASTSTCLLPGAAAGGDDCELWALRCKPRLAIIIGSISASEDQGRLL